MRRTTAQKAVWTTAYVNSLPNSAFLYVEPGKDDSEGKRVPRSKRHFPVRDANGKLDAAHVRNAIARIPQSNAPGLNKEALQNRARRLLASAKMRHQNPPKAMHKHGWAGAQADEMMEDMLPETEQRVIGGGKKKKPGDRMRGGSRMRRGKASLTVFKDANGQYRWILYSSNPYQDRDDEFVTQKAQEADVARMNETGEFGPLRWWHMGKPYFDDPRDWTTIHPGKGIDLGTCDFAAMHGRVRVESGTFLSESIGRSVAEHAPDLEGSIAYAHPEDQPDDGGGFLDIMTFERSLTPQMQASNPFTALLVQSKERNMDSDKLKTLKELGVDIDAVLDGAERIQRKADRKAPYRAKAASNGVSEDEVEVDENDLVTKLDRLTDQIASMQKAMQDEADPEPEERLEDLLVGELTVAELQDVLNTAISVKAAKPTGAAFELVLDELKEIKDILTSKSITSVVDQVGKLQAKLERLSARTKGIGGKVRELEEDRPRMIQRGTRPSTADETLLDELSEEGEVSEKSANPFAWIEDYVQRQ